MDIEKIREWLAAEARASEHAFTREVTAAALAEIDKLRVQRQHLSDWSGVDISEIDRMYADGELG